MMLSKGALHILSGSTVAQSIVFQYNPNKVTRSISPRLVGGEPRSHSANLRFGATPDEQYQMTIEIDALDNLPSKAQQQVAPTDGIYPLLSGLELLMGPSVSEMRANQTQLQAGTLQVAPYQAPSLLLDWGEKRIVPVTIASYSVDEDFFNAALAPMRASVQLGLRVVTSDDVRSANKLSKSYLSYQLFKETEAGYL
ncbi:MAG: hypothetical protein JKP96_04845 [Oceanicaulis sp.]|jgi:hypothetical protein|nr:hypothetical protein [Oceanicaulis sp.]